MDSNKLTDNIKKWLDTPAEERDFLNGARLLLKATGNRFIYIANISSPEKRAPYLEYDLQKQLKYRLAGMTRQAVAEMADETAGKMKAIGITEDPESASEKTAGNAGKGKRGDHDALPDEIKKLYADNLELRHKMQQCHLAIRTQLQKLTDCTAGDCYAFLTELLKLEKEYTANWEKYDNFKLTE